MDDDSVRTKIGPYSHIENVGMILGTPRLAKIIGFAGVCAVVEVAAYMQLGVRFCFVTRIVKLKFPGG